jgi:hypothetical protein
MVTYPDALNAMHLFLDKIGETHWRDWIAEDLRQWEASNSVVHHLSAYGGMGSFNDMAGPPPEERGITRAQEYLENFLFSDLKSICYYLAKHVSRSVSMDGMLRSMEAQYPLHGWRCLNCGHPEVGPDDIDFYIAQYLVREGIVDAVERSDLDGFVQDVIASGIPSMESERSRVKDAVLRSGIKIGSTDGWKRPCPVCGSTDTVVYEWQAEGILGMRFTPDPGNRPLKS